MLYIAPSILAADYAALGEDVRKVPNADLIHVDIMDGHFVPNLSFGPDVTKAVDGVTEQFLDMHLMIEQPEKWFETYVAAGGDRLVFHVEATSDHVAAAKAVHELGVEAGFGGQKFMPEVLSKVRTLREHITGAKLDTIIAIDGGIAEATIVQAAAAGVESFVAGSAVFGKDDPAAAVDTLRRLAQAAR